MTQGALGSVGLSVETEERPVTTIDVVRLIGGRAALLQQGEPTVFGESEGTERYSSLRIESMFGPNAYIAYSHTFPLMCKFCKACPAPCL